MSLLAPFRHLWHRPALIIAFVVGVGSSWIAKHYAGDVSSVLLGWCAGVLAYLVAAIWNVFHATTATIRQRAALLDEGAGAVLFLTVAAAVASIAAIVAELAEAKESSHASAAATLAVITIMLSWAFIHMVFAFHYAHEYYGRSDGDAAKGLDFPSTKNPNYRDFIYFSFVIGMTAQVADVAATSTGMRMVILAHSIVAFFFNTAILALGINLAADLVH